MQVNGILQGRNRVITIGLGHDDSDLVDNNTESAFPANQIVGRDSLRSKDFVQVA